MNPKIALISIVSSDVDKMKHFYNEVMGFKIKLEVGDYVEFESEGVRFSVSGTSTMKEVTGMKDHYDRKGGNFELAFPVESPAEVDKVYDEITSKGAVAIKGPADMQWGQRTAFFADPDGNIHEIFCDLK